MSVQIVVRIDAELKKKVSRFAMAEGKNASQVVREMLEQYVSDRDVGAYIDQLWDTIGQKFIQNGLHLPDVEQAIAKTRQRR